MTEKLRIDLELKGVPVERFKAVKEYFGYKRNTSVLYTLITEKYRAIQKLKTRKLLVDPETYAKLEAKAKEKGQSVDEYVLEAIHTSAKKLEKLKVP